MEVHRRDDRGLSNSVQLSLLFPLAFGVLLLTMQWAMVAWADATALAAAQDAARHAAARGGTAAAGQRVGTAAAANGSMEHVRVAVERGALRTSVSVTGSAHSVIPGFSPSIVKTVDVPTERLTRP